MRFTITLFAVLFTVISLSQAAETEESGLQKLFERSALLDTEEGWTDINVGMMMKRSEEDTPGLSKRSPEAHSTSHVFVPRDPDTGKLALPTSWADASRLIKRDIPTLVKTHMKRGTTHVRRGMKVIITWYTGNDLRNPSCFSDAANWAPTDNSMVAATTMVWAGKPKCGEFVQIRHHEKKHKKIVVRIVDSCAGCAEGTAHLDLTRAAFKKLYNVNVGFVSGLQAKVVKAPVGHDWDKQDIKLYGPKECLSNQ